MHTVFSFYAELSQFVLKPKWDWIYCPWEKLGDLWTLWLAACSTRRPCQSRLIWEWWINWPQLLVYCIFPSAGGHRSAVGFTLRASCHQYHWPVERSSDPRESCTKKLCCYHDKDRVGIFHIPEMMGAEDVLPYLCLRSATVTFLWTASLPTAAPTLPQGIRFGGYHRMINMIQITPTDRGEEKLLLVFVLVQHAGPCEVKRQLC